MHLIGLFLSKNTEALSNGFALPFILAHTLMEHPFLATDAHDAIFERAFPLVLHALDFVVCT